MLLKLHISNTLSTVNHILKISSKTTLPDFPNCEPMFKMLSNTKFYLENLQISEINEISTTSYILTLNKYLNQLHHESGLWKEELTSSQIQDFIIITSKLQTITAFLQIAPFVPKNDLFSIESTHERWKKIDQITENFHEFKQEKIKTKFQHIMKQIAFIQATLSESHVYNNFSVIKNLKILAKGAYFFVFKTKAMKKAEVMYAQPELKYVLYMLNLLEKKWMMRLMSFVNERIKFNQIFYVPRCFSNVISENFNKKQSEGSFSLEKKQDYVMMRLLNSKKLLVSEEKTLFKEGVSEKKFIFHIHGGGFISMSSGSHQSYTRTWANTLKIPIFSIDYRLSPEYPYPCALDDTWQGLNWLLNYLQNHINLSNDSYIIIGDSAGGNLALALLSKIISLKIKKPDGIILAYPALRLDPHFFTESLFKSLEDFLLPHLFLKLCLKSYLQNNEKFNDPLVSPYFIPNEIIKEFPSVRLLIGTEDPLYDDCFRFSEKLIQAGVDLKIAKFFGAYHAGLNLSFQGGIKECKDMVSTVTKWVQEIFSRSK